MLHGVLHPRYPGIHNIYGCPYVHGTYLSIKVNIYSLFIQEWIVDLYFTINARVVLSTCGNDA